MKIFIFYYFLLNLILYIKGCKVHQNTDIVENNLMFIKGQPTDCCGYCKSIEACKAYAWKDEEGGTCWLKSATGPTVVNSGVIIGYPVLGRLFLFV
uniref:Apple domain-containing protein n=1 Tax=Panagrolaimus sp. PS1159 TaxID=55785 RepID=A0AC35GJR1_9BILA